MVLTKSATVQTTRINSVSTLTLQGGTRSLDNTTVTRLTGVNLNDSKLIFNKPWAYDASISATAFSGKPAHANVTLTQV